MAQWRQACLAHVLAPHAQRGQQLREPAEVAHAVVGHPPEHVEGVVALGDGQRGGALQRVVRGHHAAQRLRRRALDLGGADDVLLLHHDAGGVAVAVGDVDEGELARAPEDEVVGPLGQRVVEQGQHHGHVEAVVGRQLQDGVGGVLVHGVEAEQLGGARAVHREVGAHHDGRPRGAHVDAPVGAVQPVEVARQVGHPRQEQVGQGHGLGVLAEAVAGQDGVGVLGCQIEQHAAQAVDRLHHLQQRVALERVDAHRAEVARAARQVQPAADLLAQRADQVLLARVEPAPHAETRLLHALLLHRAQGLQDGRAVLPAQQAFLHQHDGVGLVEGVHHAQHGPRAAGVETPQFGSISSLSRMPARRKPRYSGDGCLSMGESVAAGAGAVHRAVGSGASAPAHVQRHTRIRA